jgi:hypothetical protein
MKTMFLAAAAVLCLGMGAAYADGGDTEGGGVPNTYFSELPGVIATAPGQPPNDVAVNSQYAAPPANTAVVLPRTNNGG